MATKPASLPSKVTKMTVADLALWCSAAALQRFKRFQQLVEERLGQWHQVANYADRLGYRE